MITLQTDFSLWDAARVADEAFTRELERVYGRDACNARYRFKHEDPAVNAAKDAKLNADMAWLAEMRRSA